MAWPIRKLRSDCRSCRNGIPAKTYKVVVVGELGHGGALAAGDDERVEALQLLRLAHLHPLHPDPPQRCADTRQNQKMPTQTCIIKAREMSVYRPCARCRIPAARGRRPPPSLPASLCLSLGNWGAWLRLNRWGGGQSLRDRGGWCLVVASPDGMEGSEREGRKKVHVARGGGEPATTPGD